MDSDSKCARISAEVNWASHPQLEGLVFCPSTLRDAGRTTGVNSEGPDIVEIYSKNTSG